MIPPFHYQTIIGYICMTLEQVVYHIKIDFRGKAVTNYLALIGSELYMYFKIVKQTC